MAEIIRLEPHARKPAAEGRIGAQTAAIIIFPGVRYEKPAAMAEAGPPSGKGKPRKAN